MHVAILYLNQCFHSRQIKPLSSTVWTGANISRACPKEISKTITEIPKRTRLCLHGRLLFLGQFPFVLANVVLHSMTDLIRDPSRPRLFSFERFDIPNPRPSELLHRCPACVHPFWYYDHEGARYDALAVFVDGACTGNGTPLAKGGYGVYFGPNSPYNVSKPLKKDSPQTSQRAELTAALVALYQIERFVKQFDDTMKRFIIITDSAYLVNSLTSYVYKWRNNDYTSSAGKEVVNRDLFEDWIISWILWQTEDSTSMYYSGKSTEAKMRTPMS